MGRVYDVNRARMHAAAAARIEMQKYECPAFILMSLGYIRAYHR